MPYRPKNSRNWHYDFQIRGRRFYGSCDTEDFEEAKAVEAEARVAARNAPEVTRNFTLSEALGTYFSEVSTHQPSAKTTMSQFRSILAVIKPATPLSKLTDADLMRFRSTRRSEVSNATINRTLAAFDRALRHMEKTHGATLATLDFGAKKLPEPKERVRELTLAEQKRLFENLRPDLHPIVQFALMTGARQGSICKLRWRDIDVDTGRMTFRMKTDSGTSAKSMTFPMSSENKALLSTLPRATDPKHASFVFTFEVQNRRMKSRRRILQNSTAFEHFRAAVRAAEIEDFHFHDLRHTFATRMLRKTQNIKLVSRLLGHSEITTTSRYAHVIDSDLAGALESFSALDSKESRSPSRSHNKNTI
ncbi:tyrosine-type recombinase/integrase [Thioclava sp.]|uniref:tyrosine-type recombinase/integrase n=1 Tax=Thioclava sp. TaxID=1933450 RepID=UPI003AA9CB89